MFLTLFLKPFQVFNFLLEEYMFPFKSLLFFNSLKEFFVLLDLFYRMFNMRIGVNRSLNLSRLFLRCLLNVFYVKEKRLYWCLNRTQLGLEYLLSFFYLFIYFFLLKRLIFKPDLLNKSNVFVQNLLSLSFENRIKPSKKSWGSCHIWLQCHCLHLTGHQFNSCPLFRLRCGRLIWFQNWFLSLVFLSFDYKLSIMPHIFSFLLCYRRYMLS